MTEILKKELLQKIERLEAFEERMMIRFENISVTIVDKDSFNLFFEAHPITGTKINETIIIDCIIYDKNGAIIDKKYTYLIKDSFFGFEVVDFFISGNEILDKVGKIRIYPKK